jgi:hypothetical protein
LRKGDERRTLRQVNVGVKKAEQKKVARKLLNFSRIPIETHTFERCVRIEN